MKARIARHVVSIVSVFVGVGASTLRGSIDPTVVKEDSHGEEHSSSFGFLPDVKCFMAAWNADNAETTCGVSQDKDGNACMWCPMQGTEDRAGACVSKAEAESKWASYLYLKCPV